MMADVLIAGGGIAGSSLAIMLGRQGMHVELFERGHFPREKACGEGIMPAGVGVLERLGVAEAVGGVPFYGVRYHLGGETAEGRFPPTAGMPIAGRGQRRRHLDKVLFEVAAATRGVKAHTDSPVESLHRENERVTGAWVKGEVHRAALVVVADGAQSRIRQQLGLNIRPQRKRFAMRLHFRLASNREQPPWVDVFVGRGYEMYVTPLPEREIMVAGLADAQALDGPLEQTFRRWRDSQPALAARLEGAEQVSSLQCVAPLTARARCGVMPGVILLGDAACFLDPITGGGMAQALVTAELLVSYISHGVASHDDWIWTFERDRQALLRDYRLLSQSVLWLACHPRLGTKALTLLRISPPLFSHLIGVAGGVRRLFRVKGHGAPQIREVKFMKGATSLPTDIT